MRLENAIELGKAIIFQSTHPLRDATKKEDFTQMGLLFQSTHPLRDATMLNGIGLTV